MTDTGRHDEPRLCDTDFPKPPSAARLSRIQARTRLDPIWQQPERAEDSKDEPGVPRDPA